MATRHRNVRFRKAVQDIAATYVITAKGKDGQGCRIFAVTGGSKPYEVSGGVAAIARVVHRCRALTGTSDPRPGLACDCDQHILSVTGQDELDPCQRTRPAHNRVGGVKGLQFLAQVRAQRPQFGHGRQHRVASQHHRALLAARHQPRPPLGQQVATTVALVAGGEREFGDGHNPVPLQHRQRADLKQQTCRGHQGRRDRRQSGVLAVGREGQRHGDSWLAGS